MPREVVDVPADDVVDRRAGRAVEVGFECQHGLVAGAGLDDDPTGEVDGADAAEGPQ